MCVSLMLPSLNAGSTKWSHEYRSPVCSIASASPHVSECTHRLGGSPCQLASATSNICTYTSPTSRRTQSSKTSIRNRP